MRAFNSFQMVALFAGMPFLLGWVGDASQAMGGWYSAAFWAALVVYVVLFGFVWGAVFFGIGGGR